MNLVWHQWLTIGLATLFIPAAASHGFAAGVLAVGCVLAIVWGFAEANAKDAARAERDSALTWARRSRESQR